MFGWLREKNRERLRQAPFPERWVEWVEEHVSHYRYLSPLEQQVLQDDLRIFIHEKRWEGCGGLELTEEMQVIIAAQASLMALSLERKYYPNVPTVLVYPAAYRVKVRKVGPLGVVTESYEHRLGEAWDRHGPVVISWADAQTGGWNAEDGRNVVIHEFAHKLDMLNGAADGTPRLYDDEAYERWYEVMKAEWGLLTEVGGPRRTMLNPYAGTHVAELFAVASEVFFERPRQMLHRHPALYDVLSEYYRQDPAGRIEALELSGDL